MQQVKKPKKPLIFYYCVVLLVMVLLNTIVVPSLLKTQIKEVDYGTFLTMLNDKEVDTAQVEYDVMQRGLKAQMKYANKIGAAFVMVLGENELQDKKAKLKNMETGEQIEIALDETFEDKFDDIAVQYMFHDIVEDFEKECQ